MKSAFVCPKCRSVYSLDTETPLDGGPCPQCDLQMHYTGVTTETWNKLSKDEQTALEEKVIEEYRSPQTMYLKRMSNDVRTMKNIFIFYLVLSILAGVIWALQSCIS